MLIKTKVIGLGQAGNKVAIMAAEKNVVKIDDIMLINTTDRDIPSEYKSDAFIFGDEMNGCGKERDLAKEKFEEVINNDIKFKEDLSSFLDVSTDDYMVIVVSSTEGGTGSGASPLLAKYLAENEIPTHIIGLTGFEDDPKGMENTLNWMQDLDTSLVVHMIDNRKFMDLAKSKEKAELLANEEICNIINIISGSTITESDTKNIDSTDLYKIVNQPGYMIVEESSLDGIESKDDFNSKMKEMVKSSKAIKTVPKCWNMGVIINAKPKTVECIDESFKIVSDAYGAAYEKFFHYQDVGGEQYIQFIFDKMDRPKEEIQSLVERYNRAADKVKYEDDDNFEDAFTGFKARSGGKNTFHKSSKKVNLLRSLKREKPIESKRLNTLGNTEDNTSKSEL